MSFVTRSRLWRWWALENWRGAADLLAKFATVLGAIAVANFFVLKPDIVWDVSLHSKLDGARLVDSYGGSENVPPTVTRAIEEHNRQNGEQLFRSDLFQDDLSSLTLFEPLSSDALASLIEFYRSDLAEELGEVTVPQFAVNLAASGNLTLDQMEFALRALEESRYLLGRVRISNAGQAAVRGVSITPPAGFVPYGPASEVFDLVAGAQRTVEFRADGESMLARAMENARLFPLRESGLASALFVGAFNEERFAQLDRIAPIEEGFRVLWEPSDALDAPALLTIGALLLVLWLLVVVKDIFFPQSNSGGLAEARPDDSQPNSAAEFFE